MKFRDTHFGHDAFTRSDLIATIGSVALLLVVAMPVLAKPGVLGRTAVCQANHQNLIRAWQLFATDNNANIVSATGNQLQPDWSGGGWMDYSTSAINLDPSLSVMRSPLWRYTDKQASTFRCPADLSTSSSPTYRNGEESPRVRSYSMNSWMGANGWPGSAGVFATWRNLGDFTTMRPSDAFVLLDERSDSINDGFFAVDMTGYGNTNGTLRMVDFPASYHDGSGMFSFADGHVESHRWQDARTIPPLVQKQYIPLNVGSPGNPDVTWLQNHATRPK